MSHQKKSAERKSQVRNKINQNNNNWQPPKTDCELSAIDECDYHMS